ncbi:polysaccharide deacetylase family protein [Actinomyces capricornis]|uniref:NodB homology domain-containing protein n=1 Tax=Actinomyces capricornis TaxID=2755559 RepID=A0ABM7UD37_9ACTO|nr:polysaccharide deacetylase family protein [Actinomyces capricornis]BDA65094.1 hypothetical protein MANAM107_19280 [Actinomyces capricornis]
MQRRDFMLLLAAGTAGALTACSARRTAGRPADPASAPTPTAGHHPAGSTGPATASATPSASPTPSLSPLHLQDGPPELPAPTPPGAVITGLPQNVGDVLALTIDDGASPEVVDAYLDFARDSGVRLTFFINSIYPSWTQSRDKLTPMVDSGQVQLANHTHSHAALTSLSTAGIIEELAQCESFLNTTYGVTGMPFVRPPYGYRNEATDAACAQAGYSTSVMWYGSLGDSGLLAPEVLLGEAEKWLQAQHIVLGHANAPTVTQLYGQIIEILRSRSLLTATLDDIYLGPDHDRRV